MDQQQQCPICMLYLLPGMNLQDHLDTHPKDMIIKALLSAKTEPKRDSPVCNEPAQPTVFLTTATPFNSSQTHIYQDQHQQHKQSQQHQNLQQPMQNSFAIAKRNAGNNNNTVMFNNRPYRLTLDAPQTSTTFLNPNTSYGPRTTVNDVDVYDNKTPAFRCIQNTEQKNIMIVNTSSTQFIQQLPVKKPSAQAIELHPVLVDNSGMPIATNSVPNAISIIPRYTSEKYSGPPPSYSTAISSVTNTLNDKPRVIDLTQTPTTSTMKVMERHSSNSGSNGHKKMTTLNGNATSDNRHMMIRGPPILEYTQNENGDFLITEKLNRPSTSSQALMISHEEEVIAETPGSSPSKYSIKFVDDETDLTYDISADDANGKFSNGQEYSMEESMTMMQNQEEGEIIENGKQTTFTSSPQKSNNGVKVLSNVKLTSSEMFSPSINDIIKQYNNQTEKKEVAAESDIEMVEELNKHCESADGQFTLINCTETLSLSKDESTSGCTSVIRKSTATPGADSSVASPSESSKKDEPRPSTSGCARNSNLVFNLNLSNRLKINKQPKKLVVKLKKPLVEMGECSSSKGPVPVEMPRKTTNNETISIKKEIVCKREEIETPAQDQENVSSKTEIEAAKHFDTTFLDTHDYEHINTIEVTPEILHDSETNQSLMSMDLEPENHSVKQEQVDDDFPVVIKTENTFSTSSSATSTSSSQSSCSNSSAGPSGITIESVTSTNNNSPLNFLYQNDRVRFSPPLSPYVYLKTFSSAHGDDQPKQEADISWNGSNSLALQNSDHNSTSSRYTPSFDDNRSSYMDLDGNNKTNLSAADIRTPSTDSLNIRTDEKMPARGEISEQESNGEIEQPWHPFFQLQAYPSSYDMSTAQECWNLSKADSQNACDSNNIQNVIINFPPLNAQSDDIKTPDLLKTIMQTVTKQEPTGIDDEASGSNSNLIVKRNRTFRCPECSKFFVKLRARNRHIEQAHPHLRRSKKSKTAPTSTQTSKSETSMFPSTSSALVNWSATTTSQEPQEVKVLSIIKSEPSTSAAVLVKNEMNRMLISTTGSIKMEMDRLLLEPSTSSTSQLSTLGLKIKRTYMCAKCNEQFRTLKLLEKHFQIHPAECTLCQKNFNSWNTFSLHLKHHLNIRVHACRFCPKRFVQRQRLVEHERVHTGAMPIKCPHCDERFRRYSNMLHHRARVHLNKKAKQEDFVCDCGEIFQTKAKLEWHQETHENKPKPCPYCRERFTHRNSLTRHIRLSHTDKYVFAKSKAVNCPICNSTYLPSSIKAHMATHQISNKEYSCSICSKQFSTKWNLKQHHWTHANRSTKPFQCNICPSAFVRETDYTTHMNAHRSIKPFTCNTCGKRFVRKYNWLRHSREHEREKKFVCETCNKKFHRAYYLTEHKRVHTGERPFSCTICGKTSATKTNHNKHIKIHHARDPLTAEG